jgi:anti-sigma factor RsiW
MKKNLSTEHPDDAALLGYLDAELSRAAMRTTSKHLQSCWKCRSALAELERQAQSISRLLSNQDDSEIARTQHAKAKFMSSKISLETFLEWSLRKEGPTFFKSGVAGTVLCDYLPRLLFI